MQWNTVKGSATPLTMRAPRQLAVTWCSLRRDAPRPWLLDAPSNTSELTRT